MKDGKIKVWFPAIRAGTGSDVFTRRLAQALEKRGLATEISWYPLACEPLAPLLRMARPPAGTDIIFANSWNGFAFRRAGVPLVVTLHHGGFHPTAQQHRSAAQSLYRRVLIAPFEKKSFAQADAITAVSRFAADSLQANWPGAIEIQVIYNWVDTTVFRPAEHTPPRDSDTFKLLFVGKLSRLKGADLLAPLMRRLGPRFELRIAGKGELCQDLPTNMRMLGWLDQAALVRAYQECDALILPSHSEGFGYAALEAMACGKPVIGSATAALPELISTERNGMLCECGNVAAFAAAVRALASDQGKARDYGMAARSTALEFSEARALDQYISVISQLTSGTSKKSR